MVTNMFMNVCKMCEVNWAEEGKMLCKECQESETLEQHVDEQEDDPFAQVDPQDER